jgi:hypothetical protein
MIMIIMINYDYYQHYYYHHCKSLSLVTIIDY